MAVTELQFTEGTEITNRVEDIRSMRNMAYYDGGYWWTEYDGVSTTSPWTQTLYKASTPNGTGVSQHTFSNTSRAANGYANMYTKVYGDIIISMVAHECDLGGWTVRIGIMYSLDGGSSWETNYEFQGNAVAGASQQYQGAVDAFVLGSTVYVMWTGQYGTSPDRWYCYVRDVPVTDTDVVIIYGAELVHAGIVIGSEYWFEYCDTSGNWQMGSFDGSTYTVEEQITMDSPTDADLYYQQYAKYKNTEVSVDRNYLRTRVVGSTLWTKYTAASPTYPVFIWSLDGSRIEYIIWNENIWVWTLGGSLENMQEYAGAAYVGIGDWFCDGTYQWSPTQVNVEFNKGIINNRLMNYPLARLSSSTAPFSNQWLQIYNDAVEMLYKGRVVRDKNDGSEYIYTMRSGIEEDFDVKITESYSGSTIKEIVEDIIDKYFNHIWYDTGISNVNTDTFTKNFNGVGFKDVLKWAAQYGGYVGRFTPDYELILGAFTNSSEAIDEASTTYGYSELSFETFHEKFSLIRIYGGYINGKRAESTAVGEPNQGYWQDDFATITDQTELDDMAAQILSDKNVDIVAARYMLAGKDQMYVGEYYAFTSARRSLSGATWYFIEVEYNIKNGMQIIYSTDSFWMPNPTRQEAQDDRITQNEQNIGAVEEKLGVSGYDSEDDDITYQFGQVKLGLPYAGVPGWAGFGHRDYMGPSNQYGIMQNSVGRLKLNGGTGQSIQMVIANGTPIIQVEADGIIIAQHMRLASQKAVTIYMTHTHGAGRVVYMDGTTVTFADGDLVALVTKPAIGITTEDNYIAISGVVYYSGAAAGTVYYVSGTAGYLTTATTQTYVQRVAIGVATDYVLVFPSIDVLTS